MTPNPDQQPTAPKRHIVKEIVRNKATRQWCVVCSCGKESFDETKAEAIEWHRDHVDIAKSLARS
jgi:hypothetical protein